MGSLSESAGLGEFELIDRYFARASAGVARSDVILGIGDDAALLRLGTDVDLVVSIDTLVAGRHFPEGSPSHSLGHRALAVNLSDLAAMGATPAWATLALTLPNADSAWLEGFSKGLLDLAAAHGVALVGGNTTAGPLNISVQIMGSVARGTALRRDGGKAGDVLAVTGALGDAGAGLALLLKRMTPRDAGAGQDLIQRFEYPTPRLGFGAAARGIASAAMDLSDGLVGDLPKLCIASGMGADVEVSQLPLSTAMRAAVSEPAAREFALAGGEDYELLVAVPAQRFDELKAVARQLNLTLTAIGELRPGSAVSWSLEGRSYVPRTEGYDHFR